MPQACRSKESSEDGGAEKGPSGAAWVKAWDTLDEGPLAGQFDLVEIALTR